MIGAIPLDDLPRPGVAVPLARWTELLAAEERARKLAAILDAADLATTDECTCGGKPVGDRDACPACKHLSSERNLRTKTPFPMKRDKITREQFDAACAAVWSEIQYQDALPRRTDDEAKDVPGFATLGRRYMRKLEDSWSDNPGEDVGGGNVQVPAALDGLRKLGAVFLRGMIYCGVRNR